MPYKDVWVKPDILMKCKDVIIYRTYRYNNANDMISDYHFSTNEFDTDYKEPGDGFVFDVRELETWTEPPHPPFTSGKMTEGERQHRENLWVIYRQNKVEEKHVKKAVREAIKKGLIVDGIMQTKHGV
jgi:hypothetical protein